LRFLILTQYFPPEVGAPQVRLLAMGKELKSQGHDVRVVTAMPSYPRGRVFAGYRGRWRLSEEIDGLPVTRTWIHAATGSGFGRLAGYVSFAMTSFLECLRGARPDYLFVESPPLFLGATAWLASRLRRTSYIFNVSDLWPESAVAMGLVTNRFLIGMAKGLERFSYRHAAAVCAVTEGIRDEIAKTSGAARVLLLPNGVDVKMFRRVDGSEGPVAMFVFAGTHGYAQGLDVVVEAARSLSSRPDIRFLFVGDGPEKNRLVELARDMPSIEFRDAVPVREMPRIFSSARASIVPLRKLELFKGARPSKVLPSLACETPVIYSGEGETAALLEREGCGLAVEPECPEKLAEAVERLADDPALGRAMGRRGRALVEREYSWEHITDRWLHELGAA
jgi:colanic acid biosynthesis glycosyl transferase WcaI